MVSIKTALTVITLLTICLLATDTSALNPECCRRYMLTKIPFTAIRGYSVQTHKELCSLNAIIFHTRKGKACTNPALNWVMDYVDRLRNRAQMVHMKTSKA
ncbi:C-C motif chemokine 20a.3 [Xiphias gladius]|uniref:C-C motif chemokine 20a.3 n=1 Tax=Xiphias gladius TaxID=8245 RepID=UPI001A99ABD3|nr:C-C motif chemokine 20a.3 [Xiphias gladius]